MKTRIAAAKASTTFIIAICLAFFCMALPASADGDATSGDHPSLSGTTWKIVEKWTRQNGSGGETATYVRCYDHPWVNARGDEGKPLKTMVHYPYKKNQKVPVSDTLTGWCQDGGNVELYISGALTRVVNQSLNSRIIMRNIKRRRWIGAKCKLLFYSICIFPQAF